jgi:hypothetical protein
MMPTFETREELSEYLEKLERQKKVILAVDLLKTKTRTQILEWLKHNDNIAAEMKVILNEQQKSIRGKNI